MAQAQGNPVTTLADAVAELRRDPSLPVRAKVDDLTVEIRVVAQGQPALSAAEAFEAIGPWGGETNEEILALLGEARRQRPSRRVPEL